MRKIKILNLIIFVFLFISCGPNDDDGTKAKLPEVTTEGKNTFGCKIDDQIFLPRDSGGLNLSDPVPILKALYVYDNYYFGGYRLNIFADNEILRKSIRIEMTGSQTPLEEGAIYPIIVEENDNIHATYDFWDKIVWNGDGTGYQPVYEYHTNNEVYGEMEIIKLDTTNKIISGTFWFDCKEVNNGEIARIREGRFDIKYTTSF